MAQFESAIKEVIRWEGYFSNVSGDPGGETYSGVTRHFWPQWAGWKIIDGVGPLKHNEQVPAADPLVAQFYQNNFWAISDLQTVTSQPIADKVFQHYVNMNKEALYLAILTAHGGTTSVLSMLPYLLNQVGLQDFMTGYIQRLTGYYHSLVLNHPTLQKFWHEWMLRTNGWPLSANK